MYEYIEPYPTYDKILELFMSNPNHRLDEGDIYAKFEPDKQASVRSAMVSLEEMKFIKKDSPSGNWFILLDEGSSTYNKGGFSAYLDRERTADELKQKIDSSILETHNSIRETNQSVKDTNTAAKKLYDETLPENFRSQNITTYISIGVGIVSLLFIGLSTYFQATDKTAIEVQKLKQEVTETQKKLQSIESSIREVNSSIQKTKVDTIFVKLK
jgi:hypothetical protein